MTSDPLVDSKRTESSTESAKWVGASCGQHGSYTFYKGVRFHWMSPEVVANNTRVTSRRSSNGRAPVYERYIGDERILAVGDTFFVKVTKSEPVCIGQLILLWHDDANSEDLASLRLYYLPDAIPSGRQLEHGRDEVLAVAEKITIRTSDISTWIIEPEQWDYGCKMFLPQPNTKSKKKIVVDLFSPDVSKIFMARSFIDLNCVNNEKKELIKKSICDKHQISSSFANNENFNEDCSSSVSSKSACRKCCNYISLRQRLEVVVLGYGEYCRYRSALKQLGTYNTNSTTLTSGNRRRVVFCRDSFEYPELIQNPLVCEEYAPVFKGRPRKKKTVKHSSRFTRNKTLKNGSKLTPEQEEDAVSARRKSSRTRDKKQPMKSPIYSIYSSHESRKTKRKRDNSCSSSTGSDSQNINNNETRPDLRRSKRKRKNSSNDLKIALQNSLKDFGPQSLDLVNSETNENQNNKRKLSPTSGRSSATPGAEFEKRSSSGRKRYPSTSSTESSTPSSPQSLILNEESANPSPSSSTPESISGNTSGSDFSEDFSVMGTSVFNLNFDDENVFTKSLMKFMELRGSPINKIPSLGFKRLNLHAFFMNVKKEGGYQKVTEAKMWRTVYKNTGANPSSTSAATCTRKHYEKLLLPFEEFLLKKPGSKINIKRMKRDAQRILKEEARKTPRMPTRRQKMLISENIESESSQSHDLIEEMEEVKTPERDEEVDEAVEKVESQLPVDPETKEVENKVTERLVIQDEPLDLSLPKPTNTTSTEIVNGQHNWSKTSQQKLPLKNPFIPKNSDVSSSRLPPLNYKPNSSSGVVKTSSPVTTYNNQQMSPLFNGQSTLRPYPNCDETNRHKALTTERILNTKPVHEVQRKPKETPQYPESTSSRSYYRPNSLLGHFRNNRQQTHIRANSNDSTKHILTNGAPTIGQTTPPIGSVRSLPQNNSLAQRPQNIKPKVPSSASLHLKRSDYEARSIMTSSHARLPKYTSSSESCRASNSGSASHQENETHINNKRPKTFPMTHFDPSGLINATSRDRNGSSSTTDLLKVPSRLTRPGEAHNSKINFQSLPGRTSNHLEDKSKQFANFSHHDNLSAKMYLKRMKESSTVGRNGHQPLLIPNLPSPDHKKRSIDKHPNIALSSNRAHESWKSPDPVPVPKPVPEAMRTASRDLASSSRSRVSNDRKDLNGSHRIPSHESRDRNIHFSSSSSSRSNPQRSNRDARSLPFSVDGFLLSSKDSKSSQPAKSRPEVKEVPKSKPETPSMSATNFIRHQIPGINYPMLPAQLAPFQYPHGQHPFLFDLNSALSIPPMYASPEEQALALQYIQQSLFHPTGLESVMRHMSPGFPFNAAQRLPDSTGIPLPLGLDPALLQALPQPPAAAFAFQNHSSHTPPVARPPNFRPFHHNNC